MTVFLLESNDEYAFAQFTATQLRWGWVEGVIMGNDFEPGILNGEYWWQFSVTEAEPNRLVFSWYDAAGTQLGSRGLIVGDGVDLRHVQIVTLFDAGGVGDSAALGGFWGANPL